MGVDLPLLEVEAHAAAAAHAAAVAAAAKAAHPAHAWIGFEG